MGGDSKIRNLPSPEITGRSGGRTVLVYGEGGDVIVGLNIGQSKAH